MIPEIEAIENGQKSPGEFLSGFSKESEHLWGNHPGIEITAGLHVPF
jgi:hypothetical protein